MQVKAGYVILYIDTEVEMAGPQARMAAWRCDLHCLYQQPSLYFRLFSLSTCDFILQLRDIHFIS